MLELSGSNKVNHIKKDSEPQDARLICQEYHIISVANAPTNISHVCKDTSKCKLAVISVHWYTCLYIRQWSHRNSYYVALKSLWETWISAHPGWLVDLGFASMWRILPVIISHLSIWEDLSVHWRLFLLLTSTVPMLSKSLFYHFQYVYKSFRSWTHSLMPRP